MALFEDEVTSLLERNGIGCTAEHFATHSILSAYRNPGKDGSGAPVKIILIPVTAATESEAMGQSLEAGALAGCPDTLSIAEDRWMKNRRIMVERLLAHLGIFRAIHARDCEIKKISRKEADSFLEKAHSYGGAKSRYCYGIFVKRERVRYSGTSAVTGQEGRILPVSGTMIAAAEFSNARRWTKDGREIRSYEWVRYASLPDIRINGGMGKVLKRFIEDVRPDDIMSYADLEWSGGQAYRELGFYEDGNKGPVLFSVDTCSWERTPVKKASDAAGTGNHAPSERYFQNFGSLKYRLRLY